MKGNPITYFRGVAREAKRVWRPKREAFLPAIGVVIAITVFAAIFSSWRFSCRNFNWTITKSIWINVRRSYGRFSGKAMVCCHHL